MDKNPKFGPTDDGWNPPFKTSTDPCDESGFDLGSINASVQYAPSTSGESQPEFSQFRAWYPKPVKTTGDPEAGK